MPKKTVETVRFRDTDSKRQLIITHGPKVTTVQYYDGDIPGSIHTIDHNSPVRFPFHTYNSKEVVVQRPKN